MKILGIESSCDETSCAIVTDASAPSERILGHIIHSQTAIHAPYGGVVPELSSRAHIDIIPQIIQQTLAQSNTALADIDAIAVTSGPGLIGGLMVGVMVAKGMAFAAQKPLIGINHLEAHALTIRLTNDIPFPYLMLLVSGGHCQIIWVEGLGKYRLLGQTIDDALGEAFDKIARMCGLPYPGGPIVEQRAKLGDPQRFKLPEPLKNRDGCDFSFSGLKTAVWQLVEKYKEQHPPASPAATTPSSPESALADSRAISSFEKDSPRISKDENSGNDEHNKDQFINDICASFQYTAGNVLTHRIARAIELCPQKPANFVIAGGVAANQYLRDRLSELTSPLGIKTLAPPLNLCTDNGAMIAWAGLEHFRQGAHDTITLTPRARWPLAESSN